MVSDIVKIIAGIQPKYSENTAEVLRTKTTEEAIKIAKPKSPAVWEHSLVYDSTAETLEPIYFWILDFMKDLGFDTEKLVDNFAAAPGSGYFAELGGRATKMQEEGMKMLGAINTVIKSIINLIYDMKEFEIRLKQYDLAKSKVPAEKESGMLGLKQIWMDKVDMQRGRGSINLMSAEVGFTTLRDAFMAAKTVEQVDKMDLNDRVKRVLKPRLAEFFEWKERSEKELRKRFEVEKTYLKSQVGSLKLYTRWAKPYLKAAEELMMKEGKEPALVKAFNTIILGLTLFGKKELKVKDAVEAEELPRSYRDLKLRRKYYSCVLIDFGFRGIPTRTPQGGYIFGGRADVSFKSFAMNDDEYNVFQSQLKKTDVEDALKLVETITGESLKQITEDIEHFLGKEEEKEKEKRKKPKKEEKNEEKPKLIRKDSYEESVIRQLAEQKAATACFKIYNIYKKAHAMPTYEEPAWEYPPKWRVSG